jgi:hypothetical protein
MVENETSCITDKVENLSLNEDNSEEDIKISDLKIDDIIDFVRWGEKNVIEDIYFSEFSYLLALIDDRGNSIIHMASANGHFGIKFALIL